MSYHVKCVKVRFHLIIAVSTMINERFLKNPVETLTRIHYSTCYVYLLYIIQILLKHFDIEKPVCDELGPILHWAAGNDKLNLARSLFSLQTPPKVDINNDKKLSPLKLAATRGFTDMVCLLIKEGKANVNYIG